MPEHEAGRAEAAAVATQIGRAGRAPVGPRGLLSLQLPPGLSLGASPLGQEGEGSRREREEGRCPKVPPSVRKGQLLTALSAASLQSSSVCTKPAPQTPSLGAWLVRGQYGTPMTVLGVG